MKIYLRPASLAISIVPVVTFLEPVTQQFVEFRLTQFREAPAKGLVQTDVWIARTIQKTSVPVVMVSLFEEREDTSDDWGAALGPRPYLTTSAHPLATFPVPSPRPIVMIGWSNNTSCSWEGGFVDEKAIRRLICEKLGLRLEDEMIRYVLKSIEDVQSAGVPVSPIPVIGGNARTGIATRTFIPPELLFTAAQP